MNGKFENISSTRTSGKKIVLSVLVVSMFLLASFAILAPVDATDRGTGNDVDLGMLIIDSSGNVKAEGGWDGHYSAKTEAGVATITLLGGTYTHKDVSSPLIVDSNTNSTVIVIKDGEEFSVTFSEGQKSPAIVSSKQLIIAGNGKFVLDGLKSMPGLPAIQSGVLDIGLPDQAPTVMIDGLIKTNTLNIHAGLVNVSVGKGGPAGINATSILLESGILNVSGQSNEAGIVANNPIQVRSGVLCVEDQNIAVSPTIEFNENADAFVKLSAKRVLKGDISKLPKNFTALTSTDGKEWKQVDKIEQSFTNLVIGVQAEDVVKATSADETKGTASAEPLIDWPSATEPKFFLNEPVMIEATAKAGCTFEKWNDDNTDNPRTVLVSSKHEQNLYVASFVGGGPTPSEEKVVDKGEYGEANVTLDGSFTSLTVKYADGASVHFDSVAAYGSGELTVSLTPQKTAEKYDLVVKVDGQSVATDNPIKVTLPYDELEGQPTAYYYPDDGSTKVDMKATINSNGTVTFTTTHNSVYGIEYTAEPEPEPVTPTSSSDNGYIPVLIIVALVILAVVAIGVKRD